MPSPRRCPTAPRQRPRRVSAVSRRASISSCHASSRARVGRGASTRRDLTRRALGLPDAEGVLPDVRWPTLAQIADQSGLTAARIAQIMGSRRKEWIADPWLTDVREELDGLLTGLGRVAAASELVEQLLASRGCVREELPERRRAYGYAVLRAAVEADSLAECPRFATRRHSGRMIVALQVRTTSPSTPPATPSCSTWLSPSRTRP